MLQAACNMLGSASYMGSAGVTTHGVFDKQKLSHAPARVPPNVLDMYTS